MSDDREFVYTPVHVTMVEPKGGEGDTLETVLSSPVCDFCFDARLRWEYDCETFTVDEIGFGSENGWLSCDRCSDLIEAENWEALHDRSIRSWIIRMGGIEEWHVKSIKMIQRGFIEHRVGERTAFG
jgi:hypothetical protein